MKSQSKKYDAFISYNWKDRNFVETVARQLREQGLKVFLDRWYLVPGRPWMQTLEEVLRDCCAMVVFIGPHGMGSWQQRETFLALDRQTHDPSFPVIPVLIPNSKPPLGFLSFNTWIDLRLGLDDPNPLAVLAKAVRGESPEPEIEEQLKQTVSKICPYRGLRPFREEDSTFFFGRETLTERLVEKVNQEAFIAVVGPSGSGKSSVVRAGLLPRLRCGTNKTIWEIATLLPGQRPFHTLSATLIPFLDPEMKEIDKLSEISKLAKYFLANEVSLPDVISHILEKQPGTDRLLLMVDQWEEVYTLCNNEQERRLFIDHLLLGTREGSLSVVLTLRGDFYGHALKHRPLSDKLQGNVINVGPMTAQELKRSVTAPAQKVGLEFESGLVSRILTDIERQPGSLPLLEFVLTTLWEKSQGSPLLHQDYETIGQLQGALAQHAEDVYGRLSSQERHVARQIFMRLVRPGEGTEDTRRRATLSEIGEAEYPVVLRLADARLLVTGRDESTSEETIEISHEALIQTWNRLRDWVSADREFLLWRQRLRVMLEEWERTGQDSSALLRGAPLTEAAHWLAQGPNDLNSAEQGFIKKSIAAREEERKSKERLRKRIFLTVMLSALLFFSLSVFAILQWLKSERQNEIILGNQLVAESELIRDQQVAQIELSALLAVEAMHRSPSKQAEQALRKSLALLPEYINHFSHIYGVSQVQVSPNGQYLSTAGYEGNVYIQKLGAKRGTLHLQYNISVNDIKFSPDNNYLAIGTEDGIAKILDLTSNKIQFLDHGEPIMKLAFSPNGRYLATLGMKGKLVIWSFKRFQQYSSFTCKNDFFFPFMTFTPDSKRLILSNQFFVRIWDVEKNRQVLQLQTESPANLQYVLPLSRNGRYLAFSPSSVLLSNLPSFSADFEIWDVTTCEKIAKAPQLLHIPENSTAKFTPDGEQLITGGLNGNIYIWDFIRNNVIKTIYTGSRILDIAISPNGEYIVTAGIEGIAKVWSVKTGEEIARLKHLMRIERVYFSPDGNYIATSSRDQTARLWRLSTCEEVARFTHHNLVTFAVDSIIFGTNGYIATRGFGEVKIWKVDLNESFSPLLSMFGEILFPESDSQLVAFSDNIREKTVLFDRESKQELITLEKAALIFGSNQEMHKVVSLVEVNDSLFVKLNDWSTVLNTAKFFIYNSKRYKEFGSETTSNIGDFVLSPDCRYIATTHYQREASPGDSPSLLRIWSIQTRGLFLNIPISIGGDIQFSAHSKYIGVEALGTLRIFNLEKGNLILLIENRGSSNFKFTKDEKYVATSNIDSTASLWEIESSTEVLRIKHAGPVKKIAISPDDRYLATGGDDGILSVWNINRRRNEHLFSLGDQVSAVAFSKDSRYIASGTHNGTIQIWNLSTSEELAFLQKNRNVLSLEFDLRDDYLGIGLQKQEIIGMDILIVQWRKEDLLNEACRRVTRNLTSEEWKQYIPYQAYRKTIPNLP